MAARLETSYQRINSGLGDRRVVESVQIGAADKKQVLAGDSINLRVILSRRRRPRLRLNVDRQYWLAAVVAYEHIGAAGCHCLDPPLVHHANHRGVLGRKAVVLHPDQHSIQALEDGIVDLLAHSQTCVVRKHLERAKGSLGTTGNDDRRGDTEASEVAAHPSIVESGNLTLT